MAHPEKAGGRPGGDGGCRKATVEHADLAEEVAGLQNPPSLAVDLDFGLALEKYVKRVACAILTRESLAGRHGHLVTLFGDELALPLREAGEKRNPAQRLELGGDTPCPQHILLPWVRPARSALYPSPTTRAP